MIPLIPFLFLLILPIVPLFAADDFSAIQQEILNLEQERKELSHSLKRDEHEEIQKEMQGQKEMTQYRWHAGAENLEKAEEAEQSGHLKEVRLKKIEAKLKSLKEKLE